MAHTNTSSLFARTFTDHPATEGETWFGHFRVAMGFSRQLIGAGLAAGVHAVLPNFHKSTASQRIHALHHCLESGDRAGVNRLHVASPCSDTQQLAS